MKIFKLIKRYGTNAPVSLDEQVGVGDVPKLPQPTPANAASPSLENENRVVSVIFPVPLLRRCQITALMRGNLCILLPINPVDIQFSANVFVQPVNLIPC